MQDHFNTVFGNLGQELEQLYHRYQILRKNKMPETPKPSAGLKASVGRSGQNLAEDVRLVQNLLNRIGAKLTADGLCGPRTIQAIVQFQQQAFAPWKGDGLIEPNKQSFQALIKAKPAVSSAAAPAPAPQKPNLNPSPAPNPPTESKPQNQGFLGQVVQDFQARLDELTILPINRPNLSENEMLIFNSRDSYHALSMGGVGRGQANQAKEVAFVQKLLGLNQTGQFDESLDKAIRDFQSFWGFRANQVDGIIGRGGNTMRALLSYQVALADKSLPNPTKAEAEFVQHPQPGAPISSPFGPRFINGIGTHQHPGIDCSNGRGSSVQAIAAGRVVRARTEGTTNEKLPLEQKKGYGNIVEIDHGNGFSSIYGHLQSYAVSVGQVLSKGFELGKEGNTGLSTGPHLHFEIRYKGKPIDPMPFIKGARSIFKFQ